jgi:hypothetical protein
MPTGRPRRTGPAGPFALALLLLSVLGLGACTSRDAGDPPGAAAGTAGSSAQSSRPVRDVVREVRRALDDRAAAVRRHDAVAFRAGLARAPALVQQQRTYLANLRQLPLARFRYVLEPADVVRDGRGYWVGVHLLMQLDGYDARPVSSPDRFRFVPARRGPDRMLLASVGDRGWERRNHVAPQPWDEGPIEVRTGSGVLGVFDARSVAEAPGVLASVQSGIRDVAAEVPYDWSRTVVVYALSDPAYLDGLPNLPGNDPARLDAVAFPVPSGRGDRLAATRFLLSPAVIGRPGPERDRLVRHELTHVAVGERDDRAPVWLAEGIAEWVSVRPLAPQQRMIPAVAVAAARRGFGGLPDDRTFNDVDSRTHYALSWWACEYLAAHGGPGALWSLLDALDQPDAQGAAGRARVLREQTGLDATRLADRAGGLILATYAPG